MKVLSSFAVLVFLAMTLSVNAQSLPGDEQMIPPAPENHVIDEAGFFRDQPEKLAEVSESLARIEAKHQYPVYLVIYYAVLDGNLQNKADELHRAWLGEQGHGMVLVYQRDPVTVGENPAIAYFQGSELDVKSGDKKDAINVIPRRDAEAMLAGVLSDLDASPDEAMDYVTEIVFRVESELDAYFSVKPPQWNDSSNLRLMAIFAGSVAALGLLGMLIWRIISRSESKSSREHYFPEVKIGRRLEAPYGGGWTSEKTFAPSSSRE